ncbi:hypothetical protein [Neisseria shayeganii]|uniref:Uncharacterized protein n=1 Tax=Neisseria shayeganii TaxID=607712 RepID=A0A7D7N8E4_9NEIS|nr:hypothetical protein [Neisseria shayeganii]QMT41121.1 hypothetical protein H3L94_03545 [Neisseria shayeganii]
MVAQAYAAIGRNALKDFANEISSFKAEIKNSEYQDEGGGLVSTTIYLGAQRPKIQAAINKAPK